MRMTLLSLLALAALPSLAEGKLVHVRFAGAITQANDSAPYGLSVEEDVWGVYSFSTSTSAVNRPFIGVQYPAVRLFSLYTASGFFARTDFGTIMLGLQPQQAELQLPPDEYLVLTTPPLLVAPPVFPPTSGGVIEEVFFPKFEFDLNAAEQGVQESMSLGLPGPGGAFLQFPKPTIVISISEPGLLPNLDLTARPPRISSASAAIGTISFGEPLDPNAPSVRFTITELAIVPEPAAEFLASVVILSAIYVRRRERC
jgi:hypothetical protein